MKRLLRGICILLVIALFLSVPVFADEAGTYASLYFTITDQYLWKISSTEVEVWFDVVATRGMDKLGVSEIKVQRSSDQNDWETMQTYTPDDYPQMLCENTGAHADCVTYTYTSGYYYRAYVTFYATGSNGTGKYSVYTPVMRL